MVHRLAKHLDSRWRRLGRGLRWFIICLAVFLIALRLALPTLIKSYVNRQLAKNPAYRGSIGDVSVHLYRGAYRINDIKILKIASGIEEPLFAAKTVDLSMEWKELFHGSIVGEVAMAQPQVNFVAGPSEDETQTGKEERWDLVLESLFPFKLNRLDIDGGEVRFRNHHSTPPVNIFINELLCTATNLSNSRDLESELPAGINAKGKTIGGGGVEIQLLLNPLSDAPTYEIIATVTNIDLVALNDFLNAYGKFDVERGVFSLYTSVASKEGNYDGYLKVFFENLDVFAWEKERKKNVLQVFWQAIVGTLTTVFKNQPNDTLATRVPISGNYQGSDVGVWTAVLNVLQNAFIRALVPRLDEKVKVEEVEEKVEEKKKPASSSSASPPQPELKGAQVLKQP